MPIIGLTDRGAQFPQIGTLRKGGEKTDPKRPGPDLDHFRFDPADDQAAADFTAAYGDKPRSIRIYLPFDTTDENLHAWNEHWVAGGLVRRCDGETCVLAQRPGGKGYDHTPHPCVCRTMPADSRDRCKPVGRLKVIIPELKRLAYVVAMTTSLHDIKNLSEQMRALEAVRGSLRGIPMILSRIEREISMPSNDGKRVRRSKWLLAIEAAPHWVSLQLQAQERAALPEPVVAYPALMAPMDTDEEDDAPPAPTVQPQPTHSSASGAIETAPNVRYSPEGKVGINFRLGGKNFVILDAAPALAYLDQDDEVVISYHSEVIKGRSYNVVGTIDGPRDADGDTPWEARAAAEAESGATFAPTADEAAGAA